MITIPSDLRPGDCSDCIKSPWKLRGAKVRQGELEELELRQQRFGSGIKSGEGG